MQAFLPTSGWAPGGTTFQDALNAAIRGVRANGDLAQAVVSARDGVWQIAPLARQGEGGHWQGVVVDGPHLPNDVTGVSAQRINEAIQAIVGRDTVFNFTGSQLPKVSLYGADAWKGERLATIETTSKSPYGGKTLTLLGREDAADVGTDFGDAVFKATLAARDGFNATQAVVLGGDNHYYLTRVDGLDGQTPFVRVRDIAKARPESSSLQAIVGSKGVFNFSGNKLEGAIDMAPLAMPAAPTGRPSVPALAMAARPTTKAGA